MIARVRRSGAPDKCCSVALGAHATAHASAGDRGAAMVEAALVIPVMLLFFFGITQIALGMSASASATGASRTGARLAAATYAGATRSSEPGAVHNALENIRLGVERDISSRPPRSTPVRLEIFRATPEGTPVGGSCGTDCIRWTWGDTGFTGRSGSWSSPDACGSTVDRVGVRVTILYSTGTPFIGDLNIQRTTTMRLEPLADITC